MMNIRKTKNIEPPPPLTKQAELAAYQQAQADFESEAAETHKGFCHYFTARQGIEFDSLPELYLMYLESCGPLHFWFEEGNRRQRVEVLKYVIKTMKPTKMQQETQELKAKALNLQNEVVRALWWKQPYASAMLIGKIETRTWPTKVRGKVLICASAKPYSYNELKGISGETLLYMEEDFAYSNIPMYIQDLDGHAIAIGDLVDCRPMTKEDEAFTYVQYREGLYCHIYENVQAIKPFPIKGAQGWRILTEEQKQMIELL